MTKVPAPHRPSPSDSAVADALEKLRRIIEEDRKAKIQITQPAAGASLVLPIDMEATWTRPIQPGSFTASVGGRDATSLFAVDETAMKATAKAVRIGDPACDSANAVENMTLVVSANIPKNLPKPDYYRTEASCSFTLAGPAYAIMVNATETTGAEPHPNYAPVYRLDVLRGSSALVRVTVVPYNAFASDVEITALASQPPAPPLSGPFTQGITFNTPFVIKAGEDHGLLQINVDSTLAGGEYSVVVISMAPDDFDHGAAQVALINLTVHATA